MFFAPTVITSVDELLKTLLSFDTTAMFRGQARSDWKLTTSLERACPDTGMRPDYERYLQQRFRESFSRLGGNGDFQDCRQPECPQEELWAHMQHHGAPTRLLDWSDSPFVALFFAIEHPSTDAAVFVLDRVELEIAMSARLNLTTVELSAFGPLIGWSSGHGFHDRCNEPSPLPCVAVIDPSRSSHRLWSQQGRLLMPVCLTCPFEENLRETFVPGTQPLARKLIIKQELRDEALRMLWKMNVSRSVAVSRSRRVRCESPAHGPGAPAISSARCDSSNLC